MNKLKKTRISKINIGGLPFRIRYFKVLPRKLKDELGENTMGYCDWSNQEIGVVLNKKSSINQLTLFHEIGHAVADSIKVHNALANETFARPFFQFFFGALIDAGLINLK